MKFQCNIVASLWLNLGEGGMDIQDLSGSPFTVMAPVVALWWLNLRVAWIVVIVVPQDDLGGSFLVQWDSCGTIKGLELLFGGGVGGDIRNLGFSSIAKLPHSLKHRDNFGVDVTL